jgi:hypothetical protein
VGEDAVIMGTPGGFCGPSDLIAIHGSRVLGLLRDAKEDRYTLMYGCSPRGNGALLFANRNDGRTVIIAVSEDESYVFRQSRGVAP